MELLRNSLAFALSLLGKAAEPALRSRLSDLACWIVPDAPRLAGAWVVKFRDPLPGGGARVRCIDAELTQYGRLVHGTGHLQGEPGDPFQYRGWIKRNAFHGEFRRRSRSVLAGTGTFVLKIAADGEKMEGRCGWYDSGLDDVWSSNYLWRRND